VRACPGPAPTSKQGCAHPATDRRPPNGCAAQHDRQRLQCKCKCKCAQETHLNARVHAEAAGGWEPVGGVAGQERSPALVALRYLRSAPLASYTYLRHLRSVPLPSYLRHLRHSLTGAAVKGAALRQWCSQPASPTPGAATQRCLRMQSPMVGSRGTHDARAPGRGMTRRAWCARQRCLGVHSPWSDGVNVRLPSHAIAKCSRDQPALPKALPADGGRVK
jgi:hypothetical protein